MPTFELTAATEAKMTDFVILSDKDREPDTNPGVSIALILTLGNECLTMFDGGMRSALYTKNANSSGQQQIESVAPDMPNLTGMGKALKEFSWDAELAGYTMTFDHGLAGSSNIDLSDCKLTDWKFFPKEGGSVQVKLKVESPDVPESVRGKLSGFKSQQVHVLFAPPVVDEPAADLADQGSKPARKRRGQQAIED